MRKSDYEIFEEKFDPLIDEEQADFRRFETFGEEFEEAKRLGGENCEFLWTIVEGDNKKWYIVPGFSLVNKEYYLITKKPWNEETRIYLYS